MNTDLVWTIRSIRAIRGKKSNFRCRWQQITKAKSTPRHHLTFFNFQRVFEDRPGKDKSVKLPVFTARIDAGRKFGQQRGIEKAPRKPWIQLLRVHAHQDGLKPCLE